MERLWNADLGDGRYRNPILYADYSDPDVIRVGDVYYMTASSFNYIPGLPILISKDLVNWRLVNYALRRLGADNDGADSGKPQITYENYDVPQHAKGVWAPAIRWHEGYFYIFYGMPDEGIFMVKTKDALGEWDEPVCVMAGKGRIDPCPFWDDDGKAYVIHAYAKSRIGFNSMLGIFEIDPASCRAVSEDRIFYDGTKTQPTIEGPKVYKRNGRYYILAPAGGVRKGWQTALRAADILGPYEERIVMKQGSSSINGPHQGGLTDTVNGEEWFVHFRDRGLYGRIVYLEPVTWIDGWPVMGSNIADGCGEPVEAWSCPNVEPAGTNAPKQTCRDSEPEGSDAELERGNSCAGNRAVFGYLEASDDFETSTLNLMWQWLGNPREDFYSLTEQPGRLRLYCHPSEEDGGLCAESPAVMDARTKAFARPATDTKASDGTILWKCSNVLTQKLVCPEFSAECRLDAGALAVGARAGLVMLGGEYAFLAVRRASLGFEILYGSSEEENGEKKERIVPVAEVDAGDVSSVTFSLTLEAGPKVHMYYQLASKEKTEVTQAAVFVPSDHTWVGAKLGLFAVCDGRPGGYADFEYMHVAALKNDDAAGK